MLEKALNEIAKTRVRLINQCKSDDEVLAIGTALLFDAQKVFTELGGEKHAAGQFYAFADRLAAPKAEPTP